MCRTLVKHRVHLTEARLKFFMALLRALVSLSCKSDFPMDNKCTNLPSRLPTVCSHHSTAGISGIQEGWVLTFNPRGSAIEYLTS